MKTRQPSLGFSLSVINAHLNSSAVTFLFPSDISSMVLVEQTDEWAAGRRYLGLDVLARCRLSVVASKQEAASKEVGADPFQALST